MVEGGIIRLIFIKYSGKGEIENVREWTYNSSDPSLTDLKVLRLLKSFGFSSIFLNSLNELITQTKKARAIIIMAIINMFIIKWFALH